MLELRILAGRPAVPLLDLSAVIGREAAARTVGDQIEAMMALLDDLDGDSDFEDDADLEPDHDREVSYPEWDMRGRHKITHGGGEMARTADVSEDDEDDDPAEDDDEDCCTAADDWITGGCAPACRNSDAYQLTGSEDDAEPDGSDDSGEPIAWGDHTVVPVRDVSTLKQITGNYPYRAPSVAPANDR